MELSQRQIDDFRERLAEFYGAHARDLPWRRPGKDGCFDPYAIMVSELMLQQTQVGRVIPKYGAFLQAFPTVEVLAAANLGDVLRLWQGLGYNRRAKFLWQAAQAIQAHGVFPGTPKELVELPGIGTNTAGAILAYAFNRPVVFVETNIRTVYLHHFFAGRLQVPDADIRALLQQTLLRDNPREFYWALMDYGTHLKATVGNPNAASKHYSRQSRFEGSRRQVRGQVLRLLGQRPQTAGELAAIINDVRLDSVLTELAAEALIRESDGLFGLD